MELGPPPGPPRESGLWTLALAGVLVLTFAVGVALGDEFGASTDEGTNVEAARTATAAYSGRDVAFGHNPSALVEHGPAYFMLWLTAGEAIHKLASSWTESDGRHLFNFTVFLLGAALFFSLSRSLLSPRSAFMATLVFLFQPVLFGYGFINQKDIPFMVLFMAVVLAGVNSADHFHRMASRDKGGDEGGGKRRRNGSRAAMLDEWRGLGPVGQVALGVTVVALAVLLGSLTLKGWVYLWGEAIIREAYAGNGPEPIQWLFSRIASDAYKTPVELYLAKYDRAFKLARVVAIAVVGGALIAGGGRAFPSLRVRLLAVVRSGYPILLMAGALLGFAVCVRQIGLFGGALVSAYMIYRLRRRAFPLLAIYGVAAMLVTFGTWPYLWPSPIGRFWESITAVATDHSVDVLYWGEVFDADKLPWYFVPTLAAFELTEPAVLLGILGLPITIARARAGRIPWALTALYGAWVAVPVGAVLLSVVTVYDNLRHLLFVLPPMFVISGIGLDSIINLARSPQIRGAILAVVLLPGVLGIARMHPYEYSYYNSLIGGVSGAYAKFDVDHWCTSLREAMAVVNEHGKRGATVYVGAIVENARPFQRGDLRLERVDEAIPRADYVLACRPTLARDWGSIGFSRIYQVRRGEAVFAEVWERGRGGESGRD